MEQIAKVFIKAFLIFVVCISLFKVLTSIQDNTGNTGILKILGSNVNQFGNNVRPTTSEYTTIVTESKKQRPQIEYDTTKYIHAKNEVDLNQYIIVHDYSDKEISFKLLEIKNVMRNELVDTTQPNNIIFPYSGEYSIKIQVVDDTNRKEICTINVPVLRDNENNNK